MIYQLFSLVLSALFLLFMFWALWYIALPLLAVAVIVSAIGVLAKKIKRKTTAHQARHRPIHADDVIDVDFKEVK